MYYCIYGNTRVGPRRKKGDCARMYECLCVWLVLRFGCFPCGVSVWGALKGG